MGRAIDWEARRRDDETTRRRDHKTAKNNAGITRIISKFRSPAVSQSRSLEVSKSRSLEVPQSRSPLKNTAVLSRSQAFSVFLRRSQSFPATLSCATIPRTYAEKVSLSPSASNLIGFVRSMSPARMRFDSSFTTSRCMHRLMGRAP